MESRDAKTSVRDRCPDWLNRYLQEDSTKDEEDGDVDEEEDEDLGEEEKKPTHHSELDLKVMKVCRRSRTHWPGQSSRVDVK